MEDQQYLPVRCWKMFSGVTLFDLFFQDTDCLFLCLSETNSKAFTKQFKMVYNQSEQICEIAFKELSKNCWEKVGIVCLCKKHSFLTKTLL